MPFTASVIFPPSTSSARSAAPRWLAGVASWLVFSAASAQPAAPVQAPGASAAANASPIAYASVEQALAGLKAQSDTVVTEADGWVVINETGANAQWSFTPQGYYAYPAVVRRTVQRVPGSGKVVQMTSLCEAGKDACDKLLAEFAASNDRMRQYIKSRESSRSGE